MEWWGQGVFTWPLLACLDLCQISLPGTERIGAVNTWRAAPCIGYWYSGNRLCSCAPVWDLFWHKAVSKSEKAGLQVFITCAGCLRLRASGVVWLSTVDGPSAFP